MVTKMTIKNQVTIPKKILEKAGLSGLKDEDRYFDVNLRNNAIILKPVTLLVEERIPEEQWQKFEGYISKVEKGDKVFDSVKHAAYFLKKRAKKK